MHRTSLTTMVAAVVMMAALAWAAPSPGAPPASGPALVAQVPAATPTIGPVVVNPASPVAGDTITVAFWGTASSTCTFDLGNRTGNPMHESLTGMQGGNYQGTYKVTLDDHFHNQTVIVRMRTPAGATLTKASDTTVTIVPKLQIDDIDVNPKGPYHLGDMVTLTVRATPHGQVAADVGGLALQLREASAGTYSVNFRFAPTQPGNPKVHVTLTMDTRNLAKDGATMYINTDH